MSLKAKSYFQLDHFKVFGSIQVEVDSLQLEEHQWMMVEAPSGFGKTTFLRGLVGLEKTSGEIWLDGKRIDSVAIQKREIGMVFQDHLLFPHLTASENVAFGLSVRGVEKTEALNQARAEMKKLGLEEKYDAVIPGLSGGERQRLAILRALIWKPKLLILDEPFKGLDEALKAQTFQLLTQHSDQNRVAVLCVTHTTDRASVLPHQAGARLVGTTSGEPTHVRKFYCS